MTRRVIDVDGAGAPLDGETLMTANPAGVVMGLVEVEKVTLRFPDGREEEGQTIRITKRGMTALRKEIGGAQ